MWNFRQTGVSQTLVLTSLPHFGWQPSEAPNSSGFLLDRSETDGWEHIFEKVVRSGGTADIDTVWVGGVDVTNHLDASGK